MSTTSGGWVPFKEILNVIENVIIHKQSDLYTEIDEVLNKHKLAFINILKNQERNASQLEELKKAPKDGLNLSCGVIRLNEKYIEKVVLFSEGVQLNEFASVELFLAADAQEANFPGLTPQCIASLLYHDGRKSLLSALKLLLTARPGLTWTLDLDDRINELIEKFVFELIENGLISNLLKLLQDISLMEEIQKLEKARAISDGKHKKLITEIILEQQVLIADCLFAISSQHPFSKNDCIKVVNYLKSIAPNTSDGSFDRVSLRVLLSLLTTFNCDILDGIIADIDADETCLKLPYFKDENFFSELHQVIIRPDAQVWETPAIKCIIQFCWAVFLRTCGSHPQLSNVEAEILEEDEGTLDEALENDAFKHITIGILNHHAFFDEEYFVKLTHSFVTSFIVKFPLKVKELRNRGDDNARVIQAHLVENIEPPLGLRHDFEDLMKLVSKLYKEDPLDLELNKDFWLPLEPLGNTFMPQPKKKLQQAIEQKKVMLNKFIRLAGDILLQPLYVPYINMLTSLSNNEDAASFCFRLLASNGSVDHIGSCSVTWDHFFSSLKQYYISLSQDVNMSDGRHIHSHQKISPEELEALEATLNLIKTVAYHNENVRIAFCENQNWLPVASLFGLVSCAVSPQLKGKLMEALGAFAITPDIASSLWISLEASQVLQTNKLIHPHLKKSGIAVELEEIESRNEAFPETRGFLDLIDKLTDSSIPSTLGAGSRVPGFGPYLEFLYTDVFLKFRSRAYQNPEEKWKVGVAVMKIFVKILSDYDIKGEDFVDQDIDIQGVKFGKADKPSGFQLLTLLYNDTPLLCTTLSILNDCQETLSTMLFNDKLKSCMETLAELCLSLLSIGLEKQTAFLEAARVNCPSILLSQLDELLLGINPHSSHPDYLLMLAKYLTINNLRLSVVHHVIKIFKYVCKHMSSQQEIVSIICQNEVTAREILVGFAERLELVDAEQDVVEDIESDYTKVEAMEDLIRQDLVDILMTSAESPSPNFGQFMLGFDMRQPISKTNLQDAGVAGFPKTCLHSVMDILNRNITSAGLVKSLTPKLTELLYRLIYVLYCDDEMATPVRRYLRTSKNFLKLHCQYLPYLPINDEDNVDEIQYVRLANQQAWLLKTVAIEMKVLASRSARSNLERLVDILFEEKESINQPAVPSSSSHSMTQQSFFELSRRDTFSRTMNSIPFTSAPSRNIIISLLSSLSFEQRYPPNVEFQFFDYSAVEQLINACEDVTAASGGGGVTLCNIKKLFRLVMNEVNNSQLATGVGQRQDILKDIHALLRHAVDRNVVRESFHAKHNVIEAWGQVIEVLFCSCSSEILPDAYKLSNITEILQQLLIRLNNEESLSELTSPLTRIMLTLFASLSFSLKQCVTEDRHQAASLNPVLSSVVTLLPNLIEAIINSSSASARVRSNLYGAFLYYIRIVDMNEKSDGKGVGSTLFSKSEIFSSIQTSTYEILNKYGDAFMTVLAKDICQGPCINRMMALSVSDTITSLDWKDKYLIYLTSHGYLRVLIDQLLSDDVELQNVLLPRPTSMKPLYLFQSKMSFLSKVATSEYGVQALLQNGLLTRLSECQFFDMCVNKISSQLNSTQQISSSYDPFMPDIVERSAALYCVFAKVVLACLSSAGLRHRAVVSQVQSLMLCHEELLLGVLQNQSRVLGTSSIEQVSLTVAMLSMLSVNVNEYDAWDVLSDEQRHWKLFMNRIQRLMPILLQRFSTTSAKKSLEEILKQDDYPRNVFKMSPLNKKYVEVRLSFLRIRSRILTYFKNTLLSPKTTSSRTRRIICAPSFDENMLLETSALAASTVGKSITEKQLPSLALFLQELKDAPDQLKHCLDSKRNVERKLQTLTDMSQEELREILTQESESEKLPFDKKAQVARRILSHLMELRTEEANCISYNVEVILYILWHHVDYYYNRCAPMEDTSADISTHFKSSRARRLTERSYESSPSKVNSRSNRKFDNTFDGINEDHLQQFKDDAPQVLNDVFWKKMKDFDKMYNESRTRLSFMSALIRRTQGLVKLHN